MKTTIVIPNYNGMRFLEGCLGALSKDTSAPFDVILVDNGSTDGSPEWLRSKYPRYTLLSLPANEGFSKAVNEGIRAAKSEYVILLNNDTEVVWGFVKALEDALERHENAFSVSARMADLYHPRLFDGAGDLYCALGWAFALGKGRVVEECYRREAEIFAACAGAAIYRRDLLLQLGMFDEAHFAYLEDCDIGYRAQLHGYRNYYTPEALVYHAGSGASGSRYNAFKISLSSRNSVYLIFKNMPYWQILLNLPLLLAGFLVKILFFFKKGYGKTYLKGLYRGLQLSLSREGRLHRQDFSGRSLRCLLRIQWKLWENTVRRFTG
ncbi:MAG: glycosyltransferase family 2 protein [Lachnospiraceae bacterium]|nr:glycosyltransferase family 2 protein [Lachnospiraceae bacterium]